MVAASKSSCGSAANSTNNCTDSSSANRPSSITPQLGTAQPSDGPRRAVQIPEPECEVGDGQASALAEAAPKDEHWEVTTTQPELAWTVPSALILRNQQAANAEGRVCYELAGGVTTGPVAECVQKSHVVEHHRAMQPKPPLAPHNW